MTLASAVSPSGGMDLLPRNQVPIERRRSGRMEKVEPTLLPLLRHPEQANVLDDYAGAEDTDDLGAFAGISIALLLAIPFWGIVGWWAWTLLLR